MARTSSGGRVTGKASGRRPPLTRGRKPRRRSAQTPRRPMAGKNPSWCSSTTSGSCAISSATMTPISRCSRTGSASRPWSTAMWSSLRGPEQSRETAQVRARAALRPAGARRDDRRRRSGRRHPPCAHAEPVAEVTRPTRRPPGPRRTADPHAQAPDHRAHADAERLSRGACRRTTSCSPPVRPAPARPISPSPSPPRAWRAANATG